MWFISFAESNCKNCYACARVCTVKAITIKNEQAHINKDRCIMCGKCFKACPQNLKSIKSEIEMVKYFIKNKKITVASIAPSFISISGQNSNKIVNALKKLGFTYVEEVSTIIQDITKGSIDYINNHQQDTYITSFCPVNNELIQKHYPNLVKYIIPIIAPSIYHSKSIKSRYNEDVKVVFIGPCVAKKSDSHDEESINCVITFDELIKWFKEENIDLEKLENSEFDNIDSNDRLFAVPGNIIEQIKNNTNKRVIEVNGDKGCIEVLNAINKGKFKDYVIEMNYCELGCIGGSGMPDDICSYERKENIKNYVETIKTNKEISTNQNQISMKKEFISKYKPLKQPTKVEINKILSQMGKHKKEDELNCGACGYKTCRDKAIAVYNDMAEVSMCMPYMREKAENITNILFDRTPNMILLIDMNLEIQEINPAAQEFFKVDEKVKNVPVAILLDEDIFKNMRNNKSDIYKQTTIMNNEKSIVIQSIIWLEKNSMFLWIGDDITENEKKQERIRNKKIDAVNMAQEVINKQMVVAQEIASLLGETTAQTKVTLTKLKKLINEENL